MYEDYRKLLDRKDIDVIDICTPNNVHAEIGIAAAKAGKHIICEKPLTGAFGPELVSEEFRADDATASPNRGDVPKV